MKEIQSINPANGEIVGVLPYTSHEEIRDAVKNARRAWRSWSKTAISERARTVHAIADELVKRRDDLAPIQTAEMGMPIEAARFNVERSANFFRWYADHAEEALGDDVSYEDESERHVVTRVSRGVHVAIFPWNFPYSNMTWACGQSLLGGNAVLLKMSEEVPLTTQAFAEVLNDYLPASVFTPIYGDGEVGQELLNQDIDFVTFTGSTKTGRAVYGKASERLLPVMMELGGSAPGIVCQHVEIDKVADKLALARLGNAGQRCDGLKRLIVHESVLDSVLETLNGIFDSQVVGDPMDFETQIGPLATFRQRDLAVAQLNDALGKGAKILGTNHRDLPKEGAYVAPTILGNVTADMRVWREEVFAPILPVMSYSTDTEAIQLANDSEYGLGSHIYCGDSSHSNELSSQIDTGMVSINGAIYTRPWNPFGGIKCSGFGREHGVFGFHEMTIPKVIAASI